MKTNFKNDYPLSDSYQEGRYMIEELKKFRKAILNKSFVSQGTKTAAKYLDKVIECFEARYNKSENFNQI